MAARCVTEAFSTTSELHMENCEGWWLSSCHTSVVEHWQFKTGVLGLVPSAFLLFSITIEISIRRQNAMLRQVHRCLQKCAPPYLKGALSRMDNFWSLFMFYRHLLFLICVD